jgi:pimeloyl-ACP methyl ester carboxylesterase
MDQIELEQGIVRYREQGSGPPLLFVHGIFVNGTLWDGVTDRLADRYRCIVPDWPLGGHRPAMHADADLTPPGVARIIAAFMVALDLRDVTLVGNDTGGAMAQVTAAHHPERVRGLILTPCDAYERFLPPVLRPFQWLARVPGGLTAALQPARLRLVRHSPIAFGLLLRHPRDGALTRSWLQPFFDDPDVRRDAVKVLRGIDPRHTLEAVERLKASGLPVSLAWARDDVFFPWREAERLAADLPGTRLEAIDDARTFVSVDQPERTAALIAGFAGARAGSATGEAVSA